VSASRRPYAAASFRVPPAKPCSTCAAGHHEWGSAGYRRTRVRSGRAQRGCEAPKLACGDG
jgi:hypothetical protein